MADGSVEVAIPVAGAPARRPGAARRLMQRRSTIAFVMCVPLIAVVCGLVIYPAIYAIWLSMLNKRMTHFVALGNYYRDGIREAVRPDLDRAREMFRYAASYFGDADAQYHLGRMYLSGNGSTRDSRQAARWLRLSANKGQHEAQALLGSMFFNGEAVPRQAARGLMWLMLARDGAGEAGWISDSYNAAIKRASDDERQLALIYLEDYLRGRRD